MKQEVIVFLIICINYTYKIIFKAFRLKIIPPFPGDIINLQHQIIELSPCILFKYKKVST